MVFSRYVRALYFTLFPVPLWPPNTHARLVPKPTLVYQPMCPPSRRLYASYAFAGMERTLGILIWWTWAEGLGTPHWRFALTHKQTLNTHCRQQCHRTHFLCNLVILSRYPGSLKASSIISKSRVLYLNRFSKILTWLNFGLNLTCGSSWSPYISQVRKSSRSNGDSEPDRGSTVQSTNGGWIKLTSELIPIWWKYRIEWSWQCWRKFHWS